MFNPRLTETLTDFPFARLNALIAPITPPAHLSMINLAVGEPQGAMPAFARQIVAEAGSAATVRRQQPADHAQDRGLAGAVGTEEAADSALFDSEAYAIHDRPRAIALDEIVDLDCERHNVLRA